MERIPIGEAIILPDGSQGIRFKRKRKNGDASEVVSLDQLHELVMQNKIQASKLESTIR